MRHRRVLSLKWNILITPPVPPRLGDHHRRESRKIMGQRWEITSRKLVSGHSRAAARMNSRQATVYDRHSVCTSASPRKISALKWGCGCEIYY